MYILDSNTFIDAKNRYYGFDIVPSFWKSLIELSTNNIATIDHISREINEGHDDLKDWFQDNYTDNILKTDSIDVQTAFAHIATYVSAHERYKPEEKSRFLSKADPWLIAYASVHHDTIVTHEVSGGINTTKVKIPDICRQFNVQYINVFDMMRQLQMVI